MASAGTVQRVGRAEPSAEQRTVRDLLAASARRYAHLPALRYRVGGAYQKLTYEDLFRAVETFAAGLIRLGVRAGDKVAIVAENGPDWVIAWFGITLAGGVTVPIYGENSAHELANTLKQSEARYAVVGVPLVGKVDTRTVERVIVAGPAARGEDIAAAVGRLGPKGLSFADVTAGITAEDRQLVPTDVRPSDLATLIYTSGTTGDPKGVMLTHRNIAFDAMAVPRVVSVSSRDRILHVLPLHHAFPMTVGLLAPLHVGAEVIFESDLRRIRDRMAETRPTIFFGVPALYGTMLRSILARLESEGKMDTFRKAERIAAGVKRRTGVNVGRLIFGELHQKLGGSLRFLASGGAALPPDVARRFAVLGLPMVQGWGLSEAAPLVSGQVLSMPRFLFTGHYERLAGSVGQPIAGDEVVCTDVPDKHIFVQIHGEGELMVRGPNVMRGYYKNEAATRDAMLDDWLRTGDVGRIDRDGHIYITGRAKSVIVLESGEKVYPDELEERFESSALVKDVCIIGRRPVRLIGERRTQVCAVVYPDPMALREKARENGETVTADGVRRWVQQEVDAVSANVAPFKRIGEVILTDAPLPKTDLHKVRRGQIRDHYSFDVDRLLAGGEEPNP